MQELLQQILDEVRGAWRFRWFALIAAWAVAVIGWIVVFAWPNSYEAQARVYVDTSTALKPLLQGLAPEADVESQLNLVRQALLSRPQLEKVARETDLDLRAKTPEQKEGLIRGLAEQINIEMIVTDKRERRQANDALYVITFRDGDRAKALEVVQTLLTNFMEDTLGGKRSGSETAQQFLEQQIKDYAARLSAAEAQLAEFKKKNVGLMPSESGDYFQRVQLETEQLDRARAALRMATAKRDAIRAQLRGEKPYTTGGRQTGSLGMAPQTDIDARIRETQAKLDDLLLRYTEKHPEVIAAQNTLKELKSRREQELAALSRGEAGSGLASLDSNPVYQNLQVQLNDAQVQVAAAQSEINDRERRVAELRGRLNVAPEVEAELARLNRDYGATKSQYDALFTRLQSAKLSEQADQTGVVKFEVIDPPVANIDPVAPNRALLLPGVFFAALAIGAGLAYLLHMLRPVFISPQALAEVTGLQVLGAVTLTNRGRQQMQDRRELTLLAGGLLVLVVVFVIVMLAHTGWTAVLRSFA